jgi:hypothetical protein
VRWARKETSWAKHYRVKGNGVNFYFIDARKGLNRLESGIFCSLAINLDSARDSAMRIFSVFCLALLLVACGDPHDTKVPADISTWRDTVKPALQKLTPDEQALFAQYVRRHTIVAGEVGLFGDKADPIPEDMTIGKAIAEQRNYIALQQAKESKEKTRKDKTGEPQPGHGK